MIQNFPSSPIYFKPHSLSQICFHFFSFRLWRRNFPIRPFGPFGPIWAFEYPRPAERLTFLARGSFAEWRASKTKNRNLLLFLYLVRVFRCHDISQSAIKIWKRPFKWIINRKRQKLGVSSFVVRPKKVISEWSTVFGQFLKLICNWLTDFASSLWSPFKQLTR